MRDVPIEEVGPYACEDADVALRLMLTVLPGLAPNWPVKSLRPWR